MDYGRVLEFSFAWLREKDSLKYAAMYWTASFSFLLSLALVAYVLFHEAIASALAGDVATLAALLFEPEQFMAAILIFALVAALLYILLLLAMLYIGALL